MIRQNKYEKRQGKSTIHENFTKNQEMKPYNIETDQK